MATIRVDAGFLSKHLDSILRNFLPHGRILLAWHLTAFKMA
jgi:hypothetical protein